MPAYPNNPNYPTSYTPQPQQTASYTRRRKGRSYRFTGQSSVNTLAQGPGAARRGRRYRVFRRGNTYFHVYGYGPNAEFHRIRPSVAQELGYV